MIQQISLNLKMCYSMTQLNHRKYEVNRCFFFVIVPVVKSMNIFSVEVLWWRHFIFCSLLFEIHTLFYALFLSNTVKWTGHISNSFCESNQHALFSTSLGAPDRSWLLECAWQKVKNCSPKNPPHFNFEIGEPQNLHSIDIFLILSYKFLIEEWSNVILQDTCAHKVVND